MHRGESVLKLLTAVGSIIVYVLRIIYKREIGI